MMEAFHLFIITMQIVVVKILIITVFAFALTLIIALNFILHHAKIKIIKNVEAITHE